MNGGDAVNASAARIIMLRGAEIRQPRSHICRRKDCRPLSETDLMNDGRLPRGAKIIDSRVYVCIYQQIHVCCPDRCREYKDRLDGVCPITGAYHGQSDPERGYVAPDKRTAHFKPGLSVLKRAIPVPPAPLTKEELHAAGGTKRQRMEGDMEGPAPVPVKTEPGIRPAVPESGFYSFGSTMVKKESKTAKRNGGGPGVGGGGGGTGRKKPVPLSKRRDEAEMIVTQLLYSNVRKAINKEKTDRLANEKLKALASYYKDRMGVTFPIMVEVEGIKAIYDVDLPTLRSLKRDEQRISYYVNIILRTWEIVTTSPWGAQNPGYKFVAHALSVLYRMRSGMKLDGIQLLPYDSYLFALPARGDLYRYNESYNSSIVTEGMKHIRSAYESALAAGWPPNALSLDVP